MALKSVAPSGAAAALLSPAAVRSPGKWKICCRKNTLQANLALLAHRAQDRAPIPPDNGL